MPFKFIVLATSFIFAVVVGVFWVYPKYADISRPETGKAELLKKKEIELEKNEQMKENGVQLAKQLREKKADVDRMLEIFPRMSGEEKAVVLVDYSVRASGNSLIDIKIKEETKSAKEETPISSSASVGANNLFPLKNESADSVSQAIALGEKEEIREQRFIVDFLLGGSYEGFKKFVEELEKSPRKSRITKLEITKKTTEKETSFVLSGEVSFAYAPLKTVKQGIIPSVFLQDSFDFSPVKRFIRASEYMVPSEALPASRPNPFVL